MGKRPAPDAMGDQSGLFGVVTFEDFNSGPYSSIWTITPGGIYNRNGTRGDE